MRFSGILAVLLAASFNSAAFANDCDVSAEQREAASKTDWLTFDQTGGVEGTFRELARTQCHAAAVEAYRAWLKHHGGFPNKRAEGIGFFHIGQSLAMSGNREGAVAMIERAYRDVEEEGDRAVIWNAYVDGVLGYFARDKNRIWDAQNRLRMWDNNFAKRQEDVLAGLRRCVNRPYREAMSKSCRR